MIKDILLSLLLMAFEIFIISEILKRRSVQKEKQQWTPFRILFFQAIADHHSELMEIYKSLVGEIDKLLSSIKKTGYVTESDIEKIERITEQSDLKLDNSNKAFYNIIQTVTSSLRSEAAYQCNESLYFSYILAKYIGGIRQFISDLKEIDDLKDRAKTSHTLNGIWAKKASLKMIIDNRVALFLENFSSSIWKEERLYYHKGEILEEADYQSALRTEKSVRELSKIPRTLPVQNFFDTSND